MAAPLAAENVGQRLRDAGTRDATLTALEERAVVDRAMSLAATPALGELLAADVAEVDQEQFDRIGMLLGRLCTSAPEAYGAAFGEGRLVAAWESDGNVVSRALKKSAHKLTIADARSMACMFSSEATGSAQHMTEAVTAAGMTVLEWFGLWMSSARPMSR